MLLTIIIPVWNEEKTIKNVVEEVLNVVFLNKAQIIVVDDGSSDNTAKIVREIETEKQQLSLIKISHSGKDIALWHGIKASDTEWVGVMDGDMQNVPEDFERLFDKAATEKADAVWGIRVQRRDTTIKRLASFGGRSVKKIMFGKRAVKDCGCGIFIAQRCFLNKIIKNCAKPYGQLHCHLPELIEAQGGKITEVEVQHRRRKDGKEKFGVINRLIPGFVSLTQADRIKQKLQND